MLSSGIYGTSGTSVTLPPLSGGNTYVFTITTEVDGAANMQTGPYRSAMPTGFASVVSAPITVSAPSDATQVHGDMEEWRRVVDPKSNNQLNRQPAVSSRCSVGNSPAAAFCD